MTPETFEKYTRNVGVTYPATIQEIRAALDTAQQQLSNHILNLPEEVLTLRNKNTAQALLKITNSNNSLATLSLELHLLLVLIDSARTSIHELQQEIAPEATPENLFVLQALEVLLSQQAVLENYALSLNVLLQQIIEMQAHLIGLKNLIESETPIMQSTRAYVSAKFAKYGIPSLELETETGKALLTMVIAYLPEGIVSSPDWARYPGIQQVNALIMGYIKQHHADKIVSPIGMQWDTSTVHEPVSQPQEAAITTSPSAFFKLNNDENRLKQAFTRPFKTIDRMVLTPLQDSNGRSSNKPQQSNMKLG